MSFRVTYKVTKEMWVALPVTFLVTMPAAVAAIWQVDGPSWALGLTSSFVAIGQYATAKTVAGWICWWREDLNEATPGAAGTTPGV